MIGTYDDEPPQKMRVGTTEPVLLMSYVRGLAQHVDAVSTMTDRPGERDVMGDHVAKLLHSADLRDDTTADCHGGTDRFPIRTQTRQRRHRDRGFVDG
jgi:hypothetical protein